MWAGSLFCQCTLSLLCRMKINQFLIETSSWGLLGPALGPLQLLLGSSWDLLERSGTVLGWSWVGLGPSLALLECSWEAPGRPRRLLGTPWGDPKSIKKSIRKSIRNRVGSQDGPSRSGPTFLDTFEGWQGRWNLSGRIPSHPRKLSNRLKI